MQKLYTLLFYCLRISSLVGAAYVNCLSEKITNVRTEGMLMNLLDRHYNESHEKMMEEIEAEISETSSYTGISHLSLKVLKAFAQVPRHAFVLPGDQPWAYLNKPLPIGEGQTISQPFIVALMTELLDVQPDDKVLEIGTGSGYQAAILAHLAKEVYSIETVSSLAKAVQEKFSKFGYKNVYLLEGNGAQGWVEHAPYNKVIVTAASEDIPPKLLEQLGNNGIMVIPLGENNQFLTIVRKDKEGNVSRQTILPVHFVPFT